jgi:hypothetical protein
VIDAYQEGYRQERMHPGNHREQSIR